MHVLFVPRRGDLRAVKSEGGERSRETRESKPLFRAVKTPSAGVSEGFSTWEYSICDFWSACCWTVRCVPPSQDPPTSVKDSTLSDTSCEVGFRWKWVKRCGRVESAWETAGVAWDFMFIWCGLWFLLGVSKWAQTLYNAQGRGHHR